MATRRQQASSMNSDLLKNLNKFKMPTSEAKEEGCEGIPDWKMTSTMISLMKKFRKDVFLRNKPAIKDYIHHLVNESDDVRFLILQNVINS